MAGNREMIPLVLLKSEKFIDSLAGLIVKQIKGGPGSGSWEGPGDPRFAFEGVDQELTNTFMGATQVQNSLIKDIQSSSPEENKIFVQSEIVKATGLYPEYVKYFISQWAGTSGDSNVEAVSTQLAAREMFDLKGSVISHFSKSIRDKASNLITEDKRKFLQAQYDATQKYFKDKNIKEVLVYRGCGLSPKGKIVSSLQPLSSFSLDYDVARRFPGNVMATRVPVEKILSHPRTGFGCTSESEVVVLGGKMESIVYNVSSPLDASRLLYPLKKSLGLSSIFKGGPGSGSWEGPGDPRFAFEEDERIEEHSKITNLRQFGEWEEKNSNIADSVNSMRKSKDPGERMMVEAYDDYKVNRLFSIVDNKVNAVLSYKKEDKGYEIRFVGSTGGKGAGTKLINNVIDNAKKDNNSIVYAEARIDARTYFEKIGFSLREGTSNIYEYRAGTKSISKARPKLPPKKRKPVDKAKHEFEFRNQTSKYEKQFKKIMQDFFAIQKEAVLKSIKKKDFNGIEIKGGPGSGIHGHTTERDGNESRIVIGPKPQTAFQKKYAKKIEFEGKAIWQFPGKWAKEGKEIEIPKSIRIGKGVEATKDDGKKIIMAYENAKSELNYVKIQELIDLTGIDKNSLHEHIIFKVRNQEANLGIDRMGYAVNVKFNHIGKSFYPFDSVEEQLIIPSLGLSRLLPPRKRVIRKGGPGSGSWEGPGDPRFAREGGDGNSLLSSNKNNLEELASKIGLSVASAPFIIDLDKYDNHFNSKDKIVYWDGKRIEVLAHELSHGIMNQSGLENNYSLTKIEGDSYYSKYKEVILSLVKERATKEEYEKVVKEFEGKKNLGRGYSDGIEVNSKMGMDFWHNVFSKPWIDSNIAIEGAVSSRKLFSSYVFGSASEFWADAITARTFGVKTGLEEFVDKAVDLAIQKHKKIFVDIETKASPNPLPDRFNFSDWTFDNELWNGLLQERGGEFIKEMYDREGTRAYNGLKYYAGDLAGGFNIDEPFVQEFLEEYTFRFAKEINDYTEELLRDAMSTGMEAGLGMDGIADLVSNIPGFESDYRSELIARTETIRASNSAADMAYQQSGVVDKKQWLTADDERLCPFCAEMDGEEIDVGGNFFEKGESLTIGEGDNAVSMKFDYSDVNGPPAHPNCRCTLVPIISNSYEETETEEAAFIPQVTKLGLGKFIKGGPGSGNWEGPGDPRFAFEGKEEVSLQKEGSVYVYRGEFINLKEKILNEGIPARSFNGRPDSVYMTTDEKEAHMYGVDKALAINKEEGTWGYLIVKIALPKDQKIISDERDTIEYGRQSAIRVENKIPKEWIVDVSIYKGEASLLDKTNEEIANIMMKKSIGGTFAYIAFVVVSEKQKSLDLSAIFKGGPGSGNYGHEGRPGQVGGSGEGGGRESFGEGVLNLSAKQLEDNRNAVDIMNRDIFEREDPLVTSGFVNNIGIANKIFVQEQLSEKLKDLSYFQNSTKDPEIALQNTELYVRDNIGQWAATSGDTDIHSIGMQISAQEHFGLKEATLDHLGKNTDPKMGYMDPFKVPTFQDAIHNINIDRPLPGDQEGTYKVKDIQGAFLQAQYDATQKYFKDNDIKELVVYRGVGHSDTGKLREEVISMQPMSSFSMSALTALAFAGNIPTSEYFLPQGRSIYGTLYVTRVPVEKILSHPRTGFGCTSESEVVVLGGKMKSTIIPTQIAGEVYGTMKQLNSNDISFGRSNSFNDNFLTALNKVTPEFREKS